MAKELRSGTELGIYGDADVKPRTLRDKITDAVFQLREPIPFKVLGDIDIETKGAPVDRPDFSRNYDFGYRESLWNRYGYGLRHDSLNYRHEVGSLEDSSLVMAVCNDTGIQLAEASPAVRKPDKNGEMQPDPNHLLAQLIANPNPFHIWEDYCLAGALSYWADGNWYTQLVRDISGQVVELWYLPHFMVRPRWLGDNMSPPVPNDPTLSRFISHYQYDVPGRTPVLIPANDILHIKRGVSQGTPQLGVGAFNAVITEIYGDKQAAAFSATILRNLGIVVPLVSPKDKDTTIDPIAAQHIKERWRQGTTGERAGELMVNPIALDVTKFAFSPQELDLKELRMVPESRIAAVTRYPAAYLQFLVGLQNGTSYASYKEAREQAYESVIVPIQRGIARRINQRLMPEFQESKGGAQFFFDTSDVRVLQEDQDALMTRAAKGYLAGILRRIDARKMLKLSTTPDDEVFFDPRGGSIVKEGEDPLNLTGSGTTAPAKGFYSLADIDAYLERLEEQVKEFQPKVTKNAS